MWSWHPRLGQAFWFTGEPATVRIGVEEDRHAGGFGHAVALGELAAEHLVSFSEERRGDRCCPVVDGAQTGEISAGSALVVDESSDHRRRQRERRDFVPLDERGDLGGFESTDEDHGAMVEVGDEEVGRCDVEEWEGESEHFITRESASDPGVLGGGHHVGVGEDYSFGAPSRAARVEEPRRVLGPNDGVRVLLQGCRPSRCEREELDVGGLADLVRESVDGMVLADPERST